MRLFDRFKRGQLRLTRVEAFSDGVFAIVVTLLVLRCRRCGILRVRPISRTNSWN
jgi:Endosomal/lysosomal potassium channel TMEM175